MRKHLPRPRRISPEARAPRSGPRAGAQACRRTAAAIAALFALASPGAGQPAGPGTGVFPGLGDLAAAPQNARTAPALVTDPRRGGWFAWASGDRSAEIAADPAGCHWLAPEGAPDGTAGAWARTETQGPVNVAHCGAAGDGRTEDHAAINAALAYAARTGSHAVHVPRGTYVLGAPLMLTREMSGTVLRCENALTTTFKRRDAAPEPFHLVTDDGKEAIEGFVVEGCTFDGNRRGQADPDDNAAVIQLNSASSESSDFTLVGVRVTNFSRGGHGIHIKGYDRVTIETSTFTDGGAGLYHPIYLRRVSDVRVSGNRIRDIGSHGIKVQTTEVGATALVTGNMIENAGRCVLMQDTSSFVVASNTCRGARDYGIAATLNTDTGMRDGLISGNIVEGATIGIYMHGIRGLSVSGNVIRAAREAGIKLRMSSVGTVQGNLVVPASGAAETAFACVLVDDGPGSVEGLAIEGNLCFADPDEHPAAVDGIRVLEPGGDAGAVGISGNAMLGAVSGVRRASE